MPRGRESGQPDARRRPVIGGECALGHAAISTWQGPEIRSPQPSRWRPSARGGSIHRRLAEGGILWTERRASTHSTSISRFSRVRLRYGPAWALGMILAAVGAICSHMARIDTVWATRPLLDRLPPGGARCARRGFRSARRLGTALSLRYRFGPRARAPHRRRAERRQQGAGLRQSGLACPAGRTLEAA